MRCYSPAVVLVDSARDYRSPTETVHSFSESNPAGCRLRRSLTDAREIPAAVFRVLDHVHVRLLESERGDVDLVRGDERPDAHAHAELLGLYERRVAECHIVGDRNVVGANATREQRER